MQFTYHHILLLVTMILMSGCTVEGCTDPLADNFNPSANQDDDSCVTTGCFDEMACNFNPEASFSDQSLCFFEDVLVTFYLEDIDIDCSDLPLNLYRVDLPFTSLDDALNTTPVFVDVPIGQTINFYAPAGNSFFWICAPDAENVLEAPVDLACPWTIKELAISCNSNNLIEVYNSGTESGYQWAMRNTYF